jgi:hypothetical protein
MTENLYTCGTVEEYTPSLRFYTSTPLEVCAKCRSVENAEKPLHFAQP